MHIQRGKTTDAAKLLTIWDNVIDEDRNKELFIHSAFSKVILGFDTDNINGNCGSVRELVVDERVGELIYAAKVGVWGVDEVRTYCSNDTIRRSAKATNCIFGLRDRLWREDC